MCQGKRRDVIPVRYALQVCAEACTDTALLRRRVNGDEDQVGLLDSLVDVRREEQVLAASGPHDIFEAGLVDGQVEARAVPRVDTRLVQVHNGDLDLGALQGDDGAGGTA